MRRRLGLARSVALLAVASFLGYGLNATAADAASPQAPVAPSAKRPAQAKPPGSAAKSSSTATRGEVRIPIKDYVLANGLRVYLSKTIAPRRIPSRSRTTSARETSAPAAPVSRTFSST